MTVKEIFALRKQGKIEEAYEAIRARYATYRGKYTTLCMFWTAADVFKLRMQQCRFEEAEKIFRALQRVLPNIDDTEGNATAFMQYAARALASLPPAATVPAASPAAPLAPSGSPAVTVPASSPAVRSAATVLTDSVGEINASGEPRQPHLPHLDSAILLLPWGQKKVLDCIKTYPGISVPRISTSTHIPAKSIERHIAALIDKKLIEHRGSKKTGGYYPL